MNKNRLKTLALLSIPLAFLACSEPNDGTTGNGNGNGNGSGQGQNSAKSQYADNAIKSFKLSAEAHSSTLSPIPANYYALELWLNGQRESYFNAIKDNKQGHTYTQSELTSYDISLMKIQNDVLNKFMSNVQNKNISYTLDK